MRWGLAYHRDIRQSVKKKAKYAEEKHFISISIVLLETPSSGPPIS
jgi:hypothetical protein